MSEETPRVEYFCWACDQPLKGEEICTRCCGAEAMPGRCSLSADHPGDHEPPVVAQSEGVGAIIFLQSRGGIEETPENAAKEWAKMSPNMQRQTLTAFKVMRQALGPPSVTERGLEIPMSPTLQATLAQALCNALEQHYPEETDG